MSVLIILNHQPYDSTDVAWNALRLATKLKETNQDVRVEVCGTCMARCGIHKNEPYYAGANKSTMAKLAEWVVECEKVLTF